MAVEVQGRGVNRRTVLRGLLRGAVISVGLPPLEMFFNSNGSAYACGGAIPKRFGLFYWGNGNRPERWVPEGEGTAWELSEELAPLVNVQPKISVISGMAIHFPNLYPHTSGAAALLSGMELMGSGENITFAGPSIDQIIAGSIGVNSLYRSIQTSPTGASGLSYNGANARNPPEASPWALFERLFGPAFQLPGEGGAVDPRLALRQSVLDAVLADLNRLRAQVGRADQLRLDQHMEGVRELEQRLALLQQDPPALDACALPAAPLQSYPDIDGRPQVSAISRAQCDLLVMAMACDQTRVFGHYFSDPVSDVLYADATAGHHDLTHNELDPQPEVHEITVGIVSELAWLLERMDAVQEGDGTLLDNSAVLATSEVSLGHIHAIDDLPIVLAGSACGRLQTGVHYRSYTSENVSKVMLTLVRAMDISAASFGAAEGEVSDGVSMVEA